MAPPAPHHRTGPALPRALAAVAAGCLLLAEAGLYADSQRDALRGNLASREAAQAAAGPQRSFVPLALFQDLAALSAEVPAGARVLLVTTSTLPVAYDFHLLPRSVSLLIALDGLEAQAADLSTPAARQVRQWIAALEARGQRLGAAVLRERLAAADCLVTVAIEPDALPWPALVPPPTLLAREGAAAAWQLGAPSPDVLPPAAPQPQAVPPDDPPPGNGR